MSLLLVRHAQAAFGTDNYDQLSERGWLQARRLGDWLANSPQRFTTVICGAMRRHRETAQAIATAHGLRGLPLPEAIEDPDLNEFDHKAVIGAFVQQNPKHDATRFAASGEVHAVGALIHAALTAWASDHLDDIPERWTVFAQRVAAAGQRLSQAADRGSVLVLTSGGVISQLAQQALGATNEHAVDLNIAIRNSSISEFHLRNQSLRLSSFNTLPHLHDARELWTHF